MSRDYAYERKEQMKKELKVQLPVPIDSKRYLIGPIAFIDLLIMSPFLLVTGISLFISYRLGILGQATILLSLLPTVVIASLQLIKHKVRKDIPFLVFGVLWKIQFKKREKTFYYRKGALDMADKQDARRKIGVKSIFADCYETTDKRFVRVFEVSSINMSLMNHNEKKSVLESFKVFMNTLNFLKSIQFEQIAQPISLSRHINLFQQKNKNEENEAKRMLFKSYRTFMTDEVQKSRDLVTRKRYIVIAKKIGADREKALNDIDSQSQMLISKMEGTTFDYTTLSIKQLNNDELTKLMFTCVDYDSAIAIGDHIVSRASNRSAVTVGTDTARQMVETLTREINEKIN